MKYKGCRYCKHFQFNHTCPAFDPDPIPIYIHSGQFKHTEPFPGQKNSIVYEPSEESYNERLLKRFGEVLDNSA